MQTQDRSPKVNKDSLTKSSRLRRRWLVPGLAGAAAVVAAIALAATVLSSDDPDVASRTPLEIGEALNQAAIAGDWERARVLYADDATYSGTTGSRLSGVVENRPMGAQIEFPDPTIADWDGDGAITLFDYEAESVNEAYAAGTTTYLSCFESNSTTVVCDLPYEGYAFRTDGPILLSATYTVIEGRITDQVLDFSGMEGFYYSTTLRIEFHEWVRANRPELDAGLFANFGNLLITPDTVETHRQLIAEWVAQR